MASDSLSRWITTGLIGSWAVVLLVFGAIYFESTTGVVLVIASLLTGGGAGLAAVGRWLLGAFVALFVLPAALIAIGVGGLNEGNWGFSLISTGVLCLMAVGLVAVIARLLVLNPGRQDRRDAPAIAPTPTASVGLTRADLNALEQRLAQLVDIMLLSDDTRRVLYGDREEAAMRAAFAAHLRRGDYERAASFCAAIESELGRDDLAHELREELESIQNHAAQSELDDAIAVFDDHLERRNWGAAFAEAARIRERFPGTELIRDLEQRALAAREQHKVELRARFTEAAEHDRIDEALSLMKELDRYLSREEGEQFAPLAQRVITRHRERLGAEFRQAVQERRWADASRAGEVIVRDHPNTKMADEVRSMIDLIRTRATQAALAAGAGG